MTSLPVLKPGEPNSCPLLCIELDGTGCRSQEPDRKGHDVKVAILYTSKEFSGKKHKRAKLVNKTIVTARLNETVDSFLGRVAWVALNKYGVNNQTVIIIRGDGDPWIKNMKYDFFPKAKYFLDWWHVKKKMYLAFGEFPTELMMEYVYKRDPGGLLQHIRNVYLKDPTGLGAKTFDGIRGFYYYIENNYEGLVSSEIPPEFKAKYPGMFKRGSGAMERNIDLTVGERCKLKRMSWSTAGLDNMVFLRQNKLNRLSA